MNEDLDGERERDPSRTRFLYLWTSVGDTTTICSKARVDVP